MRRLITLVALVAAVAVAGCSSAGGVATPPAPKTARQAVYEVEVGYRSMLVIAQRYNKLPRCTDADVAIAGAKITCSDRSVIAAMRTADKDVEQAFQSAVDAAGTMSATDSRFIQVLAGVQAAMNVMQAILANHGITEASLG